MRPNCLRYLVGPLALVGFVLPWAHGPGVLAATEFSGYSLVGYAGRLQALDLPLAAAVGLWVIRGVILGAAVAGAWQAVLAPRHRWHGLYAASGWYLVVFAALAGALGLWRSGVVVPPAGLAMMIAAGAGFAACETAAPFARAVARTRRHGARAPAQALAEAVL